MNSLKLYIGAALMIASTFASAAGAPTPPSQHLTIALQPQDDVLNGAFTHVFGAADKGKTFLDIYTFTLPSPADLGGSFSSPAVINFRGVKTSDLTFSSFNLYAANSTSPLAIGTISSSGELSATPFADAGAVTFQGLSAGMYTLQIGGTVMGTSGGKYSGDITVSPVPEPETWGLMLTGMFAVGAIARRRQSSMRKQS